MTFATELLSSASAVTAVLAAMAAVGLVEVAIPLHRAGARRRAHLASNAALTAIALATNIVLNAALVLVLVWLGRRGLGALNAVALPFAAEVVVVLVALDLATWLAHWGMHRVPSFWRFHRVHHSDPFVDVTTTIRQHPAESMLRFTAIAVGAVVLGASPTALMIYRVASVAVALLEHANIRLPTRMEAVLSRIVTTPDMHKVHHSRDPAETNTNYGNLFSLFDRLLDTFTPVHRGRDVSYGLDGLDDRQTTRALLSLPFAADVAVAQRPSPPANSISTSSPVRASSHAVSSPSVTAHCCATSFASRGAADR
jgi:sterol desaturase/sphingolipid hydroxylase (fatty acid hydroxylase superfamily)